MSYRLLTTPAFEKQMLKLNKHTQKIIIAWITKNLLNCDDPRLHGKPLVENRRGQWRYRIGDYRIIAEIDNDQLILFLIEVGHRSVIYR